MKTTVIYHSADFDGIFCREIARKFLPDAELIGWDFGDAPLAIPDADVLYVMDLPLDRPFGFKWDKDVHSVKFFPGEVVWIDHHASSISSHPTDIPGYRIDGVAACRLAWVYFFSMERYKSQSTDLEDMQWFQANYPFPTKQDFIDRKLEEPLAVRLAGEYDIWDKRDPDAELFQHGLRSQDLSADDWSALLLSQRDTQVEFDLVKRLLNQGVVLQYARTKENASIIKEIGFTFQWEGLTFLACNAARYNSFLFTAGLTPEHDGCFGFKWTGKKWSVSLYGVPGKPDVDLAAIAVKHGGGGHKQACGFQCDKLPWTS